MKGETPNPHEDLIFVTRGSTLLCRTTPMNIYESNQFIVSLITTILTALEAETIEYKNYKNSIELGLEEIMKPANPKYREPYLRKLSEPNPIPEVVKPKATRKKKVK